MKQLEIGKETTINLSGNIELNSELHINIMRYASTVKFVKPEGSWSLSYVFDSLEIHKYGNLFNIVSCV